MSTYNTKYPLEMQKRMIQRARHIKDDGSYVIKDLEYKDFSCDTTYKEKQCENTFFTSELRISSRVQLVKKNRYSEEDSREVIEIFPDPLKLNELMKKRNARREQRKARYNKCKEITRKMKQSESNAVSSPIKTEPSENTSVIETCTLSIKSCSQTESPDIIDSIFVNEESEPGNCFIKIKKQALMFTGNGCFLQKTN
ncbi:unnamed protein product [Mytilus edulis]|uniref:Uncharacterized protein n=1 Tax=Mytilus edulis TaxID=6550 RepID=A0A8S3QVN8_MYTED|nr:unnamed protein product [Mytilus edulis]